MGGEMVCALPLNSNFLFFPSFAAHHRAERASCCQVTSRQLFLLFESFLYHVYGQVRTGYFLLSGTGVVFGLSGLL